MENRAEIIMLGTGNAAVTRCYNTCFVLRTGDSRLLVDAGGGNGILRRLEEADVALTELHDLFLTHAHTDHLLGMVWVVRMIAQAMNSGAYEGDLRVWSHDKALRALDTVCRATLPSKVTRLIGDRIRLCELVPDARFDAGALGMQCFDIGSTKEKQFGFRARLPDGRAVVCLGDEPFDESARTYAEGADWLLCEAFCLYDDRERFRPYEKHHSTALDAGRTARRLGVRSLLLYHTEDRTLPTRRERYTAEAARHFTGRICVPDDLERIAL